MGISKLLKKFDIKVIGKVTKEQQIIISDNVATKISNRFNYIDYGYIYTKLMKAQMYIAIIPEGVSRALYSYEEEYYVGCVSDGNRVMVVEPNCTSEGISAEHCIYCGERLYPELASPAIGHIPGNTWLYFPDTGGYYFTCVACNALCPSTTPPPEGAEIHENTPIDSNTLQPIP